FCARPALYLSLGRNCIGDVLEPLRESQHHRTTLGGVAIERSRIVLRNSLLKTGTRGAGVIAAIGAAHNVKVSPIAHEQALLSAWGRPMVRDAALARRSSP